MKDEGAHKRCELLAPAGGVAALHAAVRAGADAVYLGLDSFNARRNADNFTRETLGEAVRYAHLRNVAVYVTLNTLVLPSETRHALDAARAAAQAGADALIVQDIGLADAVVREGWGIDLHVSTQMNVHNEAGVEAAARLGASRVTLARELSLAEVGHLARAAAERGMEVEVFAHGALCVCYSGQCLLSSLVGGRSANRGLCAQPCRLPYALHREGEDEALAAPGDHLLSPQDLCTIDMVGRLVDAGVASLKIEGRMKSPDYVHAVVGVYRRVLDRVLAGEEPAGATDEERHALAEAFSRGFTTAYLEGRRGNDMMSYGRPNNRGVFVGRVARVANGAVTVAAERPIGHGDVLEFWTRRGHFAHVVEPAAELSGDQATVRPEKAVGKGDRVFRVRSAEAAFSDDALEPRIAVAGSVQVRIGRPLRVEFWVDASDAARRPGGLRDEGGEGVDEGSAASRSSGAFEGSPVEPARTKAVTADEVREHVGRFGQTPFSLAALDVQLDEGAGLGFSQLHRARAAALERLAEALAGTAGGQAVSRRGDAPASEASPETRDGLSAGSASPCDAEPFVAVWATNPACTRAAKRAGAARIYVPALNYRRGQASVTGARVAEPGQAGYPKQAVVALPTVSHDPIPPAREAALDFDAWAYAKPGKDVFVDSLGDAFRAIDQGMRVEVGCHVPAMNDHALRLLGRAGVSRVWLSPELSLGQIDALGAASPVPLGMTVAGRQELMVTEHCLLMSQGACDERCDGCPRRGRRHWLRDRKDFDFPVVTDMLGRSHLFNGVELDVVHAIPDLLACGVSAFMVDATHMDERQTAKAVSRAVRALESAKAGGQALPKPKGTTTGHLYRGVR